MPDLTCAFCAKREHEVTVMVQGPGGIDICDECIDLVNKIVAGKLAERTSVGPQDV